MVDVCDDIVWIAAFESVIMAIFWNLWVWFSTLRREYDMACISALKFTLLWAGPLVRSV